MHVGAFGLLRRVTLGDRAFPVAAARAWNSLPSSIRAASSLTWHIALTALSSVPSKTAAIHWYCSCFAGN